MDLQVLEEIGFSKGEVKVYFALLALGESTIGPISKKSNVTAAKTYPILEKLMNKGLVTSIFKSKVVHYQAFNPNRILNFIAEKKNKLNAEEEKVKNLIPILVKKQSSIVESSASVYKSYKGLRTLYDEFIEELERSKDEFIAFTLGDEYRDKSLMSFFEHYDLKRKELGIKTKLIGVHWQREYFNRKYMKSLNLEIKYLDYSAVPQGVIIVGERVATMVWSPEPVAFVIQSKKIADSYRNFFFEIWKKAKH